MLKTLRRIAAVVGILLVTALFVDFTGTCLHWFGWMAKIQLLPAILALNAGVVVALALLTLLFGRLYCSVICPLGVMQDGFAWLGKKHKKFRYSYSPAKNIIRYAMFAVMIVALVAGIGWLAALLAPYSAYGRICQTILSPIWISINNLLASWAESAGSYAFYHEDIRLSSEITFGVAAATLVILGILAWRNGRTYCNTICPVGTLLGFFSRFSLFRPMIDTSKCNSCGLCARNCKSACIDSKNHTIDCSRCVTCFDCISTCNKGAISYSRRSFGKPVAVVSAATEVPSDASRRDFLSVGIALATAAALKAEEKTVDGGLAAITDKKIPSRKTKIVPPGALGIRNLEQHCTACQLCVASCPNGVLRPSTDLESLMQPEASYERGYCRPECTACSDACPTGAIRPITTADKSSVQVGHAVWIKENCVPLIDGVACGNCERHCPTGAITMTHCQPDDEESPMYPVVNTEICIGCGACENLCPARPFSAIYVEGHENHRII